MDINDSDQSHRISKAFMNKFFRGASMIKLSARLFVVTSYSVIDFVCRHSGRVSDNQGESIRSCERFISQVANNVMRLGWNGW